jgi:toxin YoeB
MSVQINAVQWDFDAWEDYLYWQKNDKQASKRINQLVKDMRRNPYDGTGKPEPLKGNLSGFWSRRITEEHRIVYAVENEVLLILSCKGHYKD